VRLINADECPRRATATATFPALPPRNLPNVVTSSRDFPVCIG
jgi:hypothetical protein